MKIAFLTSEFPHPKIGAAGGIGTSILNLSKGLVQLGHEVVVIIYGQTKDEVFEEGGITFHSIKNIKLKGLSRLLTQKKIEKYVNQLVDNNKVDILEAPDWTGFSSRIKPKCPVVVRLHGSDTYFCHLDNRPVKFLNRLHEKRALQNADALLSVSQYTAEVTKELFQLQRDITVIPNGIDLAKFTVEADNNKDKTTDILYFGTVIRKKGSLELPLIFNEVYQKNPQARLILVGRDAQDIISGNTSTWEMMQPLFDTAALANVNYVGGVNYDEIKAYINSAAICVFPTFAEALPVSWLEAMAMNKAIVASDIGWANEIIDDGEDGFLVHPKNHKEYARKILELLENESVRNQFGTAARKKITQKFSIEIVAQQNAAFYQKLLNKK